MYQNLMKIDGILLPALRETKERKCRKEKKIRLSKLVNRKKKGGGRRTTWAIKKVPGVAGFISPLSVNTMSGGAVNKSR